MRPIREDAALLFEQATDWFVRIRAADATADDLAQWLGWLEDDPAHRVAFDRVQHIWQLSGAIEPTSLLAHPDVPPLASPKSIGLVPVGREHRHPDDFVRALAATGGARSRTAVRPKLRRPSLRWVGLSLAAGIAGAAVLPGATPHLSRGWYVVTHTAAQHITSEHAVPRAVQLPDGSQVQLGADTGVQLRFTPQRRLVEASDGEVFYRVKRDVHRPFVVQAGDVTVTAVGTAFVVRREAGAVSVTVVEGAVKVDAAEIPAPLQATAGQRVRFDLGKLVDQKSERVEGDTRIDWVSGRLLFQDEPLRVVVASLNRYAPKPIVLTDPAMAELRFTGTVFEGRTQDWINAVQRLFPVNIEETADSIVLVRRD